MSMHNLLFPEFERSYTEHRKRKMSVYEFLDQSAWPISHLMREFLNSWSNDFIDDLEFVNRFRSKQSYNHYSASFELLNYTILKNSGFTVEKHPFTGTSRRLDFKVQKQNGVEYYIECTLSGDSFHDSDEKNRIETVEEIIDDIEYFPYFINVHIKEVSSQSLSKRRLMVFLNKLKESSEGISNEVLIDNPVLFEDNGWRLKFSLSRKTNPGIKRSLGFIMNSARTIDTSKPVLSALLDKIPSSYGVTSLPYIICVNSSDLFTRHDTYMESLFGQYGNQPISLDGPFRKSFFMVGGKPINTSVSAVIVCRNFDIYTLDSSSIALYHNPFAKNPIPIGLFPFHEYSFSKAGNQLHIDNIVKDENVFDLLGINQQVFVDMKAQHKDE